MILNWRSIFHFSHTTSYPIFEFGWVWGNKWYTLKVSVNCVQKHLNLWIQTQSNQIACETLNYNSHTFLRRIIKCIYFERAKLVQNKHWFSVTRLHSALSYIDTIACQYSWPEKIYAFWRYNKW